VTTDMNILLTQLTFAATQPRACPATGVPDGAHDHIARLIVDREVHVVGRAPQQDPKHILDR
jgi:hypothetical protein